MDQPDMADARVNESAFADEESARNLAGSAADEIDSLLSPGGWLYASGLPIDEFDPGRFHTLFGRDSMIASLQLLSTRPAIARATLRVLAGLQGSRYDHRTDEEPGKIPHEYWPIAPKHHVDAGWPVRDEGMLYYGSADATCWFLILIAAQGDPDLVAELRETVSAAVSWLRRNTSDGATLLRHPVRLMEGGLLQQGWRDVSVPPLLSLEGAGILDQYGLDPGLGLADADTQAAAVVAFRAVASMSRDAADWRRATLFAATIASWFDEDTIAVDAEGELVRGAGSHLGWLLWARCHSGSSANRLAERLSQPDILTEYGLRTLAATHPAYHSQGYHRGAVWPFDSWFGWAGLQVAGRFEAAERVRRGVLRALEILGQAPELYEVTDSGPKRITNANQLQAWSVGAHVALELGHPPPMFLESPCDVDK